MTTFAKLGAISPFRFSPSEWRWKLPPPCYWKSWRVDLFMTKQLKQPQLPPLRAAPAMGSEEQHFMLLCRINLFVRTAAKQRFCSSPLFVFWCTRRFCLRDYILLTRGENGSIFKPESYNQREYLPNLQQWHRKDQENIWQYIFT